MAVITEEIAKRAARGLSAPARGLAPAAGAAAAAIAARELARRRHDHDRTPGGYRLRKGEPADLGMRRIARGRIEHAIERLRGEVDEPPAERVHIARRDLKKLRAAIRLVREELGDSVYRLENAYYRDIGRGLAGSRDAVAVRESMTALRERYRLGARFAPFELELGREDGGDDRAAMAAGATALEAGLDRIERWPLTDGHWEGLEPGLRRSYRRGRNRFSEAAEAPSDERLHEWRKRAKDLRYQVRILERADRARLVDLEDDLHRLTDHLGDDHDLILLRERAQRSTEGTEAERAELLELIDSRRGELQLEAFALGERLYDAKPRKFTGSIF
jgi:CHAD domain-containing protein